MDVKEKLVDLLRNAKAAMKAENLSCNVARDMFVVDFMIANGVTVQDGKDNDVPAKWIPVTERLPEICGYPVLMVAVNKYGQKKIVKGFTDYECPVEFCTNEKEFDLCWHCWEVTHWMPLPEPPKGE